MTPAQRNLLAAARAWWRNRRPLVFDESMHLRHPTVNTCNNVEKRLALAAARDVRQRRKGR